MNGVEGLNACARDSFRYIGTIGTLANLKI